MDKSTNGAVALKPRYLIMGGALAFVLIAPAVAMRVGGNGVNWTLSDFVFAGVMVSVVSGAYEVAARCSGKALYRAGALAALAAGFLTIWINGAVGMVGNEDNPYNSLFLGVVALALAGSFIARFRAKGMAATMSVAAAAQGALAVWALVAGWDHRGAVFSLFFMTPWVISAALFRKAADN